MQKFFVILAAILFSLPNFVNAARSDNPTCVLMKFTDDTRYDSVNSAEKLSALVFEKLFASKKFNLRETEPIKEDIEARLYDEKVDELTKFDAAINSNNYNALFEGNGFKENKAQTIATAQVGQIVTPEITSEIGKNHDAEYLIQGTIINLGTGSWLSEDLNFISGALSNVAQMASSQAAGLLGNTLSALGDVGNVAVTVKGIGVQCDIRLIKAETGEVVWSKRVIGIGESKLISVGLVTFGHENLSSALYTKAMEKAADKIVSALITDLDSHKLFLK